MEAEIDCFGWMSCSRHADCRRPASRRAVIVFHRLVPRRCAGGAGKGRADAPFAFSDFANSAFAASPALRPDAAARQGSRPAVASAASGRSRSTSRPCPCPSAAPRPTSFGAMRPTPRRRDDCRGKAPRDPRTLRNAPSMRPSRSKRSFSSKAAASRWPRPRC